MASQWTRIRLFQAHQRCPFHRKLTAFSLTLSASHHIKTKPGLKSKVVKFSCQLSSFHSNTLLKARPFSTINFSVFRGSNFGVSLHPRHLVHRPVLPYLIQQRPCATNSKKGGHGGLSPAWEHMRRFGAGSFLVAGLAFGATLVLLVYGGHFVKGRKSDCEAAGAKEDGLVTEERRRQQCKTLTLDEAIKQAQDLCNRVKDESGSPGLVVAVTVDGQLVWSQGLGYADVENRVPCQASTVMRIASISKSLTMAAVARAVESGTLDLDKPVQAYVPDFPDKTVDGEKVEVTTRQLVSHLSGVRHYSRGYMQTKQEAKENSVNPDGTKDTRKKEESPTGAAAITIGGQSKGSNPTGSLAVSGEFTEDEYYIKEKLDTAAALALFKDDPLVHKPNSKFLYTSHGWTLVAAVLEGATKQSYPKLARRLFKDLGLHNTFLDENEPLIYNRARFYVRNKKGILENAPYVDCGYKYAGGGMLSTVLDLTRFANAMLYAFQASHGVKAAQTGFLKAGTIQDLWGPVAGTEMGEGSGTFYGKGWMVTPPSTNGAYAKDEPFCVYHTGGAVGASSVLLILPDRTFPSSTAGESQEGGNSDSFIPSSTTRESQEGGNSERTFPSSTVGESQEGGNSHSSFPSSTTGESQEGGNSVDCSPPKGVAVAIITNLIRVSLTKTAYSIAKVFEQVSLD